MDDLFQVIHHLLERLDAEVIADGRAEVGVGVDVVEDPPAVEPFEIFDAADLDPCRFEDALPGFDSALRRHEGMELDGRSGWGRPAAAR